MPNLFDLSSQREQIEVPFTDWRPDLPPFNNPGFPALENALPGDAGLYRPAPRPIPFGANTLRDLVPGVSKGVGDLAGFRDPFDSTVYYFAMARDTTADTLHFFRFEEGPNAWIDVTPTTPPVGAFDAYARFRTFGTSVYASLGPSSPILTMTMGGTGPFAAVAGAPRASDMIITRGFAVAIDVIELGNPRAGTAISWSAQSDPENWVDPIANPITALSLLRGFTQLEGGGRLERIVPGVNGADAIIFGQTKIWRMVFIGPPAVWDFRIVAEDEGTTVPTSVVPANEAIYFYGRRGWSRFDGAQVVPIGAGKINRAFIRSDVQNGAFRFDPRPQSGLEKGMRASLAAEPFDEQLVLWSYRTEADDVFANLVTDTGDRLVTDQGEGLQVAVTSDESDTVIAVNEITGSWGNMKIGLQAIGRVESNRTLSDTPELIGLNNDLSIVRFAGTNLPALFETTEATGKVNNRTTVRRVWPHTDAASCEISLLARERLADAPSVSPPLLPEDDAGVPVNESGRYLSLRAEIPNGASWSFMQGLSVEVADQGQGGVR